MVTLTNTRWVSAVFIKLPPLLLYPSSKFPLPAVSTAVGDVFNQFQNTLIRVKVVAKETLKKTSIEKLMTLHIVESTKYKVTELRCLGESLA